MTGNAPFTRFDLAALSNLLPMLGCLRLALRSSVNTLYMQAAEMLDVSNNEKVPNRK